MDFMDPCLDHFLQILKMWLYVYDDSFYLFTDFPFDMVQVLNLLSYNSTVKKGLNRYSTYVKISFRVVQRNIFNLSSKILSRLSCFLILWVSLELLVILISWILMVHSCDLYSMSLSHTITVFLFVRLPCHISGLYPNVISMVT